MCVFITALLPLKHNQRTGPVADVAQTIAPIVLLSGNGAENGKNGHTLPQIKQLSFYRVHTVYQRTFVARDTNNLYGVTEILCAFVCFILAKVLKEFLLHT